MKKEYNVFDYIKWRGDLSFDDSPLNEVDNLIISMASFLDLSGIVPSLPSDKCVSWENAVRHFTERRKDRKKPGVLIPETIIELSLEAAKTRRFGSLGFTAYENTVDEEQGMQFAALGVVIPFHGIFAAFRGTDDTIVGWREDCQLAYMAETNAQQRSVSYLNELASLHSGSIYTGGHSKGGNLAVWSAVNSSPEVRGRIAAAYSNDGPGFCHDLTKTDRYHELSGKIKTIVPESSIVGMLLEHGEDYEIIHSTEAPVLQHNPISWVVDGTHFVYLSERSRFGQKSDVKIKSWIGSMSQEERIFFTETLFNILSSTNAKTLTEINQKMLKNLYVMIKAVRGMDKETRAVMNKIVARLFEADKEPAKERPLLLSQRRKDKKSQSD